MPESYRPLRNLPEVPAGRVSRLDHPEPVWRPGVGLRLRLLGGIGLILLLFVATFLTVLQGMARAQLRAQMLQAPYSVISDGLSFLRARPPGQNLGVAQGAPERYPVSAEQRLLAEQLDQVASLRSAADKALVTAPRLERRGLELVAARLELLERRTQEFAQLHSQLLQLLERDPENPDYVRSMDQLQRQLLAGRRRVIDETRQLAGLVERERERLIRDLNRSYLVARRLALSLFSVTLLMLVAVGVMIQLTVRSITRLRAVATRMAGGQYSQRVLDLPRDEIGALGREFNHMARSIAQRDRELSARSEELAGALTELEASTEARERDRARLAQARRLAVIGSMAAQVAHEVRNPLNAMGLNVEMLEEEVAELATAAGPEAAEREREAAELLVVIRREIARLGEVTDSYLELAQLPRPQPRRQPLSRIVRDLLRFLEGEHEERGVVCTLEVDEPEPLVDVDPDQLRQVVHNLVRNAADAALAGGAEGPRVELAIRHRGPLLVLTVHDEGAGMTPAQQARIFEPFFSTKKGGTGLGLPITQQIISEHDGRISCTSEPGAGTTFRIELPVAPDRDGV